MNSREKALDWLNSFDLLENAGARVAINSFIELLDQHAEEARAEQREVCADKAAEQAIICGLSSDSAEWFRQAVINAKVESDGK